MMFRFILVNLDTRKKLNLLTMIYCEDVMIDSQQLHDVNLKFPPY